jgi:hypothetical protein
MVTQVRGNEEMCLSASPQEQVGCKYFEQFWCGFSIAF